MERAFDKKAFWIITKSITYISFRMKLDEILFPLEAQLSYLCP
jgi:hypothetical protein